jgi:hypothetical protein
MGSLILILFESLMKSVFNFILNKIEWGTLWNCKKTSEHSAPAASESLSVIHNINTCPLYVYIEAICGDNLRGLIVEGQPADETLKMALSEMTAEFLFISDNSHASSVNSSIKKIYMFKIALTTYQLSIGLISSGDYSCLTLLKNFGIYLKEPANEAEREKLLKQIDSKGRGKLVQLKEELIRFGKLYKKEAGGKVPAQSYSEQIAAVSRFAGFHINKMTITLADYAAYVKQFNESLKSTQNAFNK